MATLNKIPVSWQSWPGAPGVSTFYTLGGDLDSDVAALRAFFNAHIALLPSGLLIQVPGLGDTIDDVTGQINGAWNATSAPANVTGTGAGVYAGNAGAVVHWLTALVINGRRVRGRTFMVPLIGSSYDSSGSLGTGTITTIQTAATTLITAMAGRMRVWHRPAGGLGGGSGAVDSARVPDLAVSLRSRRV